MIKGELLKGLTYEQVYKLVRCKNPQEVLDVEKQEEICLTDEQFSVASTGDLYKSSNCPKCGNKSTDLYSIGTDYLYVCPKCGKVF